MSKIRIIKIIDYKEVCFVNLNCKAFYIIQTMCRIVHLNVLKNFLEARGVSGVCLISFEYVTRALHAR